MKLFLALFNGLGLSDGIMTNHYVNNSIVDEGNKLMAPIVHDGYFIVFKIVGLALCTVVLWLVYKRFSFAVKIAVAGICAFYLFVLVWNFNIVTNIFM